MPVLYQSLAEKRSADALERIASALEVIAECQSKNNKA